MTAKEKDILKRKQLAKKIATGYKIETVKETILDKIADNVFIILSAISFISF